jgi:hypothetical protein
MNDIIIINMDRYSLERDAVLLLAQSLHLDAEDINTSLYNLWIDENHTGKSHLETLQQLEGWFGRPKQNIWWRDALIAITIARRDIDVLALRTARSWLALKSDRIPPLYWLPSEVADETYREFVERNTHPASVALEVDVEASIGSDEERGSIIVKKIYTVNFTAQAWVKGSLDIEVNPSFSEKQIETMARLQSGNVSWKYDGTIDGTVHVESMKQTGDISESAK